MLVLGISVPRCQEFASVGCVPEDDVPGVEVSSKAGARCVAAPEVKVQRWYRWEIYVRLYFNLQHTRWNECALDKTCMQAFDMMIWPEAAVRRHT